MKSATFFLIILSALNFYEIHGSPPVEKQVQPLTENQESEAGEERRALPSRPILVKSPVYSAMSQPIPKDSEWNRCYSCVDCPNVQDNTTMKMCPYYNSKCVVYAELHYSYKEIATYIRGCVTERGSCEDIEKVHKIHDGIQLLSCKECQGDLCNGVGRTVPGLITAMVFLVVTPMVAKYTLS